MAKGKKTGGKDFVPGKSGNINGRPSIPKELRDLKKYTAEELEELITTLFNATDAEIEEIIRDPAAPRIKKLMAQVLEKSYESGNMSQVDMVLSRIIGKVREKVDHFVFKPSVLVTTDGKQYVFTNKSKKEDEPA